MSHTRTAISVLAVALVLGLGVAAGVWVSTALAPERLRIAVEGLLAEATGEPARIGALRLELGFPVQIHGRALELLGGALRIDRASARVDVASLLVGRPRLTRLTLEGATLETSRTPAGEWSPSIARAVTDPGGAVHAEPALAPLRALESSARFLLERALLALTLELRRSRLVHREPGGEILRFEAVEGVLSHSQLRGRSRLTLSTRLEGERGPLGRFQWEGERSPERGVRMSLAVTDFDLAALAPRLGRSLAGRLSGVVDYAAGTPGHATVDLDLVASGLEAALDDDASALDDDASGEARRLRVERLAASTHLSLDPHHLEISNARFRAPELSLGLDAVIERPLRLSSNAGITLSFDDVDLEQARGLIGWLPEDAAQRALVVARIVRAGVIEGVEIRGAAPLELWGDLLAGRAPSLPQKLRMLADVRNVVIAVGKENRLEGVAGRLRWRGDEVTIEHATGDLNGVPLPTLDLRVSGVSALLASDARRRAIGTTASSLPGLQPLWRFFSGLGRGDPGSGPDVTLSVDYLRHPALLWPLVDVRARVSPGADGLRVDVARGLWAGVPVRGVADWTFEPAPRVAARFEAGEAALAGSDPLAPLTTVANDSEQRPWAAGTFEVGEHEGVLWRQHRATGHFRAVRGEVHLEDIEVDLAPRGHVEAHASLDLRGTDSAPYAMNFALRGGDVSTLLDQVGVGMDSATGTLDLTGALTGAFEPGVTPFASLDGRLTAQAVDGSIRRSVPPILAVALASRAFGDFGSRDALRYERCAADLGFEKGRLSTEGLEIEGPDLRLFASGGVDLAHPPHPLSAEVVLFLFGPVDRALVHIPILNDLLLGDNDNLLAAYFEVIGPWGDPVAEAKPLRTLREGPLVQGIPRIVRRGAAAIGALLRAPAAVLEVPPPAAPLRDS